jgi:ABC-type glycerol-3-phosphate transport system permease component
MRGTRRLLIVLLGVALAVSACGAPDSGDRGTTELDPSSVPDKPKQPVTLNILDVAGNLQLTQGMIENFVKAHPDVVSKVTYTKGTAPEMPGKLKALTRVLAPLLVPGILAASILVGVRTVGMFELTFLTAGPTSQTLVVALYHAVFSAGIRAQQSVDAMAVIYTMSMLVLLVVALRYVNPTHLVTRLAEEPAA